MILFALTEQKFIFNPVITIALKTTKKLICMFSMLLGTGASWNLELRNRGKREKEGKVCIEKGYAH